MVLSNIISVAIIGLIVSAYSYYVERKTVRNANYKSFCDFKEDMSCGKAFTSPYGKIAGISNALGGIFLYSAFIILAALEYQQSITLLSIIAVLGSIYLAYLQYYKLKNFCLLCTVIYIVNILLLVLSII